MLVRCRRPPTVGRPRTRGPGRPPGRGRGWLFAVGAGDRAGADRGRGDGRRARRAGTTTTAHGGESRQPARLDRHPAGTGPGQRPAVADRRPRTPSAPPSPSASATIAPTAAPRGPAAHGLGTAEHPARARPQPAHEHALRRRPRRASVDCGLKVRRPKPPLANKKLQPYLDRGRRLPDDGVQRRRWPRAASPWSKPTVKTYHKRVESPCGDLRPERVAGVLLLDHAHHLLARHRRRRARGVHVRPARLRRPRPRTSSATTCRRRRACSRRTPTAYDDASKKERYALSRRLELQAQCFEGVFLHATADDLDLSAQGPHRARGLARLHRRRGPAEGPQAGPWFVQGAVGVARARPRLRRLRRLQHLDGEGEVGHLSFARPRPSWSRLLPGGPPGAAPHNHPPGRRLRPPDLTVSSRPGSRQTHPRSAPRPESRPSRAARLPLSLRFPSAPPLSPVPPGNAEVGQRLRRFVGRRSAVSGGGARSSPGGLRATVRSG